jgi:hypothetical protein
MGISHDGGMIVGMIVRMIVGRLVSDINIPSTEELEDFEWIEENKLDRMSQWYDCPP